MEKKDIKREHLQDTMMKNIIFRFDYQGMIDSTDFVKTIEKFLGEKFESYSKNIHNSVDFSLNNLEDISKTLSIPVSELRKQDIHVFSKNLFGSDKLTLFVTVYNSILNIECDNYNNINPYIEFIHEYINQLFAQNTFLDLKRFGLRKIGSKIFSDFKEIHKVFEKQYFQFDEFASEGLRLVSNQTSEIIEHDEMKLRINFLRNLETGTNFDPETGNEEKAYLVSLDLDAYLDESALMINDYKHNLTKLITHINNSHLFDLFKASVTSEYLNKNVRP